MQEFIDKKKEFNTTFNVGVTQFIIDISEENKIEKKELGIEELYQLTEIIKKEKHLIDFGY